MKPIRKLSIKKLLPLMVAFAFIAIPSVAGNSDAVNITTGEETVYICTGSKATTYHLNSKCSGLKRCSAQIKAVSLSKAKQLGRRPCKRCGS